jgi:DNA-binding transcriptional LysR family regulator
MLDLRRLQMFRTVATHRSFSDAALHLNYTQSSVSEGVAALERELGVTLLDRSSRPVSVTPAGEIVLAHAEALLGQAAAVQADLAALAAGDAGRLRLAGFYTGWSSFLPSAVADFTRSHPRVDLALDQLDPPEALQALRAGEIDLAVIYRFDRVDPAEDPNARLVSTHLAHDSFLLAVPSSSKLARKGRLKVADLKDESWVTARIGSDYTMLLREFCREHGGFEPKLDYPSDDVAMAQPLIAAGMAVALLPSLDLAHAHPGVAVRHLPESPFGRDIWCVSHANRKLPAAPAMVDALARAAQRI